MFYENVCYQKITQGKLGNKLYIAGNIAITPHIYCVIFFKTNKMKFGNKLCVAGNIAITPRIVWGQQ